MSSAPSEDDANVIQRGRCLCGAVRIEARGKPGWVARCHCSDCRHATGAEASVFAGYTEDTARVSGEAYAEHESSPGVFRGFCTTCGTRLSYRSAAWPGEFHLHVGIMEDANAFAPKGNVMTSEKLSWVRLEPDLTNRPKFSGDN